MASLPLFDIALSGDWSAADHKMDAAGLFFQILTRAPSMAAITQVQPSFLDLLSTTCQTIQQLDRFVSLSAFHAVLNPEHPSYHDPSEYHVRQIDIVKRHLVIQHEGIVLTVRRAHQGAHPPADDFYLLINRDVKSVSFIWAILTCFRSRKPAIDRVAYLPGAYPPSFETALWTMTIGHGDLTLTHVTKLLFAISGHTTPGVHNQYYHLFKRNCFWYTRVFQSLVTRILPAGAQLQTNTYEDRNYFWYMLGSCCGLRADGSEPGEPDETEINALEARYNHDYNWFQQEVQHLHIPVPVQVDAPDEIHWPEQ